jgi:hypothetical protein
MFQGVLALLALCAVPAFATLGHPVAPFTTFTSANTSERRSDGVASALVHAGTARAKTSALALCLCQQVLGPAPCVSLSQALARAWLSRLGPICSCRRGEDTAQALRVRTGDWASQRALLREAGLVHNLVRAAGPVGGLGYKLKGLAVLLQPIRQQRFIHASVLASVLVPGSRSRHVPSASGATKASLLGPAIAWHPRPQLACTLDIAAAAGCL